MSTKQVKKNSGQVISKNRVSVDDINKSMLKEWYKHSVAPLAVPGALTMGALRPNSSIGKEWDKILENYPYSALETSTGSDLLGDLGMEDTLSRDVLGFGVDVVADPSTLAGLGGRVLTKGATHYPSIANKLTRMTGEGLKRKGTRSFIEKNIKQKDFDRGLIEPLTEYILDKNLQGDLITPKNLRNTLNGEKELNETLAKYKIFKSSKKSGGLIEESGESLGELIRQAQSKNPSVKINRNELVEKLVKAQEEANKKVGKSTVDIQKYREGLSDTFKPQKEGFVDLPPRISNKTPLLPTKEIEDSLGLLDSKISASKGASKAKSQEQAVYSAMKDQVEKENKNLLGLQGKAAQDELTSRQALKNSVVKETEAADKARKAAVAKSQQERNASLSAIERQNKEATKFNAGIEDEIDRLSQDFLLKGSDVTPIDPLPVPGKIKGLPDIPAKERADIELHNKKAKESMAQYMRKNQLPAADDLESAIAERAAAKRPIISPDEVPPALTEEMVGISDPKPWAPIPNKIRNDEIMSRSARELDVPPPTPLEDTLESLLAKKADTQESLLNSKKANQSIIKANRAEDALPSGEKLRVLEDEYSNIEGLYEIKKNLREGLDDAFKRKNEPDFKNKEAELLKQLRLVDDELYKVLSKIELPEGNAGLLFAQKNNDYHLSRKLDDLLKPIEGGKRREGGKSSRLAERVLGALAAGGGTAAMGGSPMQSMSAAVVGATGADVARKITGPAPEVLASAGTKLTNPEVAQGISQIGEKLYTLPARESEEEVVDVDPKTLVRPMNIKGRGPNSVQEEEILDVDPQNLVRGPSSIQEVKGAKEATDIMAPPSPIEQKMDEALAPQKPLFDPYFNEEVLNTILPRDSKRILENPKALLAKLQQVAPNQVPMVQDMISKDPEALAEAGPMLASMFPAVFEKDKYGMFDGKIMDPQMQQKFLTDLSQDEGMSSIEKAKLAMKVQRGESIL